jgi:hypothetical protein
VGVRVNVYVLVGSVANVPEKKQEKQKKKKKFNDNPPSH